MLDIEATPWRQMARGILFSGDNMSPRCHECRYCVRRGGKCACQLTGREVGERQEACKQFECWMGWRPDY